MVVAILAAVAGGIAIASAATLGGIRAAQLSSYSIATAPTVPVACVDDPFTAPNNTNLHGRVPPVGSGSWVVHSGPWRIITNQANSNSNATARRATIASCSANHALTVPLVFPTGVRRAGVAVRTNNAGSLGFYVEIRNNTGGQVVIGRFIGNTATAVMRVSGIGTPASQTLRVEVQGATIRAYVNGTLRATYTMGFLEQLLFGGGRRVGLWANQDQQTRFESFLVENLP
jgi:hypothetical protein